MTEYPEIIRDKLSNTPEESGVYLMKDSKGDIIYIGKAVSLKKRISSYFQKNDPDPKTLLLVRNIRDFEYVVTDSEAEALILENTLIKKHKPRFNVKLKDDKRYPYISVTLSEEFPRVIITRKITNKNDRYFGPYTDSKAARSIVSMINSAFKFRLCKKDLPLKSSERPCINFQLKKCSGLCRGNITKSDYMQIVNNAVSFLEGKVEPVLNELNHLMKSFSEKQEYEKAASIRDIILDIQKISQTQKVLIPVGSDKDYICMRTNGKEAVIIIFEFRSGVLLGRKISIFENIEASDEDEILKSFIFEYYENLQPPIRIITSINIRDKDLIEEFLAKKVSKKVRIMRPKTQEDKSIMNLIRKNLDVVIADRTALQDITDKKKGLLELKEVLNLDNLPDIIECFDISNIQGKNAVASMTRFKSGNPDKSGYRRFKIRSYDTPNDPAMIHEALARRLQYLLNEELQLPDLVVIDGGKPQLNRAIEVKNALNANIKIISIAKRFEEIFTENLKDPIRLTASSPGLKIIQNIRDEAHRFAITYHKKLRSNDLTKSLLDEIPDIGGKRKKLLLEHLGSLDKIKSSSLEEISSIPGIGDKTAKIIYDFFRKNEL